MDSNCTSLIRSFQFIVSYVLEARDVSHPLWGLNSKLHTHKIGESWMYYTGHIYLDTKNSDTLPMCQVATITESISMLLSFSALRLSPLEPH